MGNFSNFSTGVQFDGNYDGINFDFSCPNKSLKFEFHFKMWPMDSLIT